MWLVSPIPVNSYPARLVMLLLGLVILGFGISLSVIANVIMNSGEAFVKALADTLHRDFGDVKTGFDVSCVVLALILSLIFFDFTVVGTREGTVISALCTGLFVKFFTKRLKAPMEKVLC